MELSARTMQVLVTPMMQGVMLLLHHNLTALGLLTKQLANGKHLLLIQLLTLKTQSVMVGLNQINNGLKLQDLLRNNFLFKQHNNLQQRKCLNGNN